MNRSAIRTSLSVSLTIAFIAWCLWYILQRQDELRTLREVPVASLAFLFAAAAGHLILAAIFTREVSRAGGTTTRPRFYVALVTLSALMNMTLPAKGGAALRAGYLRRICGVGFLFFGASLIAYNLVYITVHGIIGLIATLLLYFQGQDIPIIIPLLAVALLAASLSSLWMPWKRVIPSGWRQRFQRLESAVAILRNGSFLSRSAAIAAAAFALTSVQYWVAFAAIGIDLSLAHVLIFVAARNAVGIVGLTPGAIGVVEAVAIGLGRVMAYSTMDALLVQTIMRGVGLVLTAAMSVPALAHLRGLPAPDLEDETVRDVKPEVGVDE